jgi:hypothetical protein
MPSKNFYLVRLHAKEHGSKEIATRRYGPDQSPLRGLNRLPPPVPTFSLPSLANPATVLRFIGNLLSPPKTCDGAGCVICLLSGGTSDKETLLFSPSSASSALLPTRLAFTTLTSTSRRVGMLALADEGRVDGAEDG